MCDTMPSRPPAKPVEQLLQLLFEQAEDYVVFFTTPDGTVTDWSPGAEHVFGFSAEEIIGESSDRLFNSEDVEHRVPDAERAMALAGGRSENDRWHVRKDGSLFWGSGALYPLQEENSRLIGYAKVLRNRTDVRTQTEALENKLRACENAMERTRVFLGTLAHEMRNPLTPLANAVELLRVHPGGFDNEEVLRIIERQVSILGRLVDDLMDASRIAAGKVQLKLEVIDLAETFLAAAEAAKPMAEAGAVELQVVRIAGVVPVCADGQRMQQVFSNLLVNAVKYAPGGRIVFELTMEGGDAVVRVEDNGIGMSPEILPRIFDLFTQEESARKYAGGGMGLGLALVRRLVELHGGSVQARSDGPGKGSTFLVRLPIYHAKQP
jgi:PAS domain S-box-containing protein